MTYGASVMCGLTASVPIGLIAPLYSGGAPPLVERALLGLGRLPDEPLRLGVGYDDERPRLLILAGGRGAGDLDRVPEQFVRHRLRREEADRAARSHALEELGRPFERVLGLEPLPAERERSVLAHA